jgi:hypothetical protein
MNGMPMGKYGMPYYEGPTKRGGRLSPAVEKTTKHPQLQLREKRMKKRES